MMANGPVEQEEPTAVSFGVEDRRFIMERKLVEKPGTFSGEEQRWPTWKMKLLGWLSVVEPQIVELMEAAEHTRVEIAAQTDTTRRRNPETSTTP